MRFRKTLATLTAAAGLLAVVPSAPAGAASAPINATIAPAWGKATLAIVRTGWTVTVKGTLTDTRADGDCVYVEAVLEVDDWTDPDKRTPDHCKGKGTSRSVDLSLTPGKGSKLSRIRVRVCAADSFKDSCKEQIWTVPAERAIKPGKKGDADKILNASMTEFLKARGEKRGGFDYHADGCSSPTGDAPGGFNFLNACRRHDFGYRNYGKGAIKVNPTDSQRATIDSRFLSDMRTVCNKYSGQPQVKCLGWAQTYYAAVRTAGGKAFYVP